MQKWAKDRRHNTKREKERARDRRGKGMKKGEKRN